MCLFLKWITRHVCPTWKGLFFCFCFVFHYWDAAFIFKAACFLPPKHNKSVVFTFDNRVPDFFFQDVIRITDWCIVSYTKLYFLIIGWWISGIWKTHSKSISTVLVFALKAAITGIAFCTGVAHWSGRIIYYKCPSWGCLQFHYYSLFEAFFVGFVGFLSHENMTENCDPCESGQISNLRAMISKPKVPSALPCCPVLPRERLTRESRTPPKGEDFTDQDWICEPKYPHINLKWKKRQSGLFYILLSQ